MARRRQPADGGIHLSGLRAMLREDVTRHLTDPRLVPGLGGPELSSRQREQANAASPTVRQAQRQIDCLNSGDLFVIGLPSPRDWPELASVPWVLDRSVRRVIVSADDTIRPA
jgi:hypothetical protein